MAIPATASKALKNTYADDGEDLGVRTFSEPDWREGDTVALKALLDLVVSRPKPEVEPDSGEWGGEGFDLSSLSTPQLRRYLSLTEEGVIERLDEEVPRPRAKGAIR